MNGIPKRFFRVWLGPKPPNALFQSWWERFHELHPSWELMTIADGMPYLDGDLKAIYNYCSTYAERTDILRFALLQETGVRARI